MRRALFIALIVVVILGAILGGLFLLVHRSAAPAENTNRISPVTTDDHMLGNPVAPVVLIEYCDIDSPYCKNFQAVMEGVIASYGKDGKVAWVYRHLPLTDQYPGAEDAAEASECAAAGGGTDTFFKFIDAVDAVSTGPTSLDNSGYADLAHALGIDADAFSACLSNHTYADLVNRQMQNALSAGAEGAPYTVLLIQGQPGLPFQGAFSYDQMKQVIDAVLAKLPA